MINPLISKPFYSLKLFQSHAHRAGEALIAAVATVIVIVYSLAWIHENPFVTGSSLQNTTLRPVVVQVDGSAISSVLGNWTDLGMVHRKYGGSHIEVFITFGSKAIKTVDGSEVLIDGLLGVEILSKSGSVEVTDVTVDMIAGKNVWLGDLLPDGYMGVEYFRAVEGPCVVQSSCYNADANREACMEASPEAQLGRKTRLPHLARLQC